MSKRKGKEVVKPKEAEQDGTSAHSPCKAPPSSLKVSLFLSISLTFIFNLNLNLSEFEFDL